MPWELDPHCSISNKISIPLNTFHITIRQLNVYRSLQCLNCFLYYLVRKSNIAKSQFFKIWFFDHFWANYNYGNAKTSIRGCTSAQIKTLRPYFSIFSITVVRICLRKQQLKFFTNMLTTPSIEHVNIWFDSASPWKAFINPNESRLWSDSKRVPPPGGCASPVLPGVCWFVIL